jgi:DNA repair exonuclease SbcCD ATPase subunit
MQPESHSADGLHQDYSVQQHHQGHGHQPNLHSLFITTLEMAKQAEKRAEQAEMRAEQAEKRAEQAEKRAEEAEKRAEQAEKRAEQAEKRAEEIERRFAEAKNQLEEEKLEVNFKGYGFQYRQDMLEGDKKELATKVAVRFCILYGSPLCECKEVHSMNVTAHHEAPTACISRVF